MTTLITASKETSPLSTPIKVDKLQLYLEGYPARSKQYLLDGFSFGFSIDYVGPRQNFSSKNLISAITYPTAVDAKLDKEIDLGRIVGPFDTRPFSYQEMVYCSGSTSRVKQN